MQQTFCYFSFLPLIKNNDKVYFIFIGIFLFLNYLNIAIMIIMAIRIKSKKLNILWPITILKFSLIFMSNTFFSQSFLSLLTIFECVDGHSFISGKLQCRSGIWFYILGTMTIIAIIFQALIALITSSLYFKPIFINIGSDLLKKSDSLPDIILVFTKIGVNLLFFLDKGSETEHWAVIFFGILFTGINAYYNVYFRSRDNKLLTLLNNILCLISVSGYICLLIGKVFKNIEFTGSIHLFLVSIIIIIIYILFYKNKEMNYIAIDYTEIKNPNDFLYYISIYYKIIRNKNNSRNYYTVLESLISKIEENCIIPDCPLKKYLENMNNGVECPFLLYQYCEKLFEYGISKFSNDITLKNNYSIFLIIDMNYKKKALMILNTIKKKALSFRSNYDIYRTLRLIDKSDSSLFTKNNTTFEYRKNIQEFKAIIKKLTVLYYDFISLLLGSKLQSVDNFDSIHKIGREIMKLSPIIEEIYNSLISVKTDNIEIIKLYSEFVEGILKDDEKLEKCQNMAKLTYSSEVEIHEKDFSNFDLEVLNEKINLPYLVISAHKDQIGKIVNLSLNAAKIFGYMKNEIIGQNINMLMPKIFHKNHDLIIKEQYEKNKLKLFDVLNKKRLYFPDFIKKDIYGISKMKFLIELKVNVYLVKTEENKLLYIVEILNYNPLVKDLVKNENNGTKFCVLTDENFLIQTFTPNCLEFLKLNSEYINSNYSIINYIKQFQDDYLTAINNTGISKYSHINSKNDINYDDKQSEQKNIKNSIPPHIKKKIKNELFFKKYSKKCKITWRNMDNSKTATKNKYLEINKSNIFGLKKSGEIKNFDTEIDLYMDIKKIVMKNELLGFYFYFTKLHDKNIININYVLEKNEMNDNSSSNLIQIKKYQYHFKSKDYIEERTPKNLSINNYNQMFNSLVIKPNKNEISNNKAMRKRERKKSLEKSSRVGFKDSEHNFMNNYYNMITKSNMQDGNENPDIVNGNYVPKFESYFSLDIKTQSFVKKNGTDESDYLETLEKEAKNKIKVYEDQMKLLSKEEETSEYEENESDDESSEDSESGIDSSVSHSLQENKKESGEKETNQDSSSKILKRRTKKFDHNESLKDGNSNIGGSTKKLINKSNLSNNYFKVNLSNVHLMVYDFYKDMIVEGNKNDIVSKVEFVMSNAKNQVPTYLEKDGGFSFMSLLHQKLKSKKSEKDNSKNQTSDINDSFKNNNNDQSKKIINEEKLFEKKISDALKKQKDEPPIKRLKIFASFFYIIMAVYGILSIYLDTIFLDKINKNVDIVKKTISVKYCSYISFYYFRELTLINFDTGYAITGGNYTEYMANSKEEIIDYIKEELMSLFIENQSSLKNIYSTSVVLSNTSATFLKKTNLKIKMSQSYEIKNIILISLMQYNGAFNNLATSTSDIKQDHPDIALFLYNSLNGYKEGINHLIRLYSLEFEAYLKTIKLIVIVLAIIIFMFTALMYVLILINFLGAIKKRGNYMKVFYGLNESILKIIIINCENLMNKLKSLEEQKYHEEEETLYQSVGDKISLDNNQKINQKQKVIISQNSNLNSGDEGKINNKASSYGITFVLIYAIFSLICYFYFIYNGIYMINTAKNSITIVDYFKKFQEFQLGLIEMFNVYREYLFDDKSKVNSTNPYKYLTETEKGTLVSNIENIQFLSTTGQEIFIKYSGLQSLIEETNLCELYENDYFDSSQDCYDKIGLITSYDFYTLSYYFLEELKIYKHIFSKKLEKKNIIGNLTKYDSNSFLNDLNNYGLNDENSGYIFRLNLFNDDTLHKHLNQIFANIILPYIQKSRKNVYELISLEYVTSYLIVLNIIFFIVVTVVFFTYILPMIKFINNIIYKTKNMLSIIPLSILSTQSGVSSLLNLSKKDK